MTSEKSIFQPSVRIVVAAHKPYWMPSDSMYVPVQVGAAGEPSIAGFAQDDTGENISDKNSRYCELTALYWANKNLDAQYIGLVHYRRHFAGSGERGVLTEDEAVKLLADYPVVLPKRRNYYIETLESHYAHTHDALHIEELRKSVAKVASRYSAALDNHLMKRGGHMFNMMIMRRDLLDELCDWMFPILFETEHHIDFDYLSQFDHRLIGRLSELLIDVWIDENRVPYIEREVISMEKVPWVRKGASFLLAKFFGRSYRNSF